MYLNMDDPEMNNLDSAKSIQQVRDWMESRGLTVIDWANEYGFNPSNVYRVLNGISKCKRGESHKIALALGLKVEKTGVVHSMQESQHQVATLKDSQKQHTKECSTMN